nr:GIY-YIG nuclease family protein [Niveispirillum sp. BGYR6]
MQGSAEGTADGIRRGGAEAGGDQFGGECGVSRTYHVYIMASDRNGTLYVGITSDLARRVYEHRQGAMAGFTKRYGVKRLVYMEPFDDVEHALRRERQIKKWNRNWKLELIEKTNPQWLDLYDQLA